MPYCNVKGIRTYYESEGNGQPILLIHGAGQDTLSWRFNIEFFAKHFQVFVIDLPGHGKSYPKDGKPITKTEVYAEFVWDFIQTLQIHNPVLMGHSMAGGISLSVAAAHPESIRAVVPVDGAAYTVKKIVSYNDEVLELASLNPTDWFELNFRTLCGSNTAPERIEEVAFDARRCAPEVAFGDLTAFTSFDMSSKIESLTCPILLIEGDEDWSVPPEAVELTYEKLTCPAEYILLEKVGHFPHTEQPALFNEKVLEGLKKLDIL
jgi:pimeloyl-ACP methyl ester carboxylesterase